MKSILHPRRMFTLTLLAAITPLFTGCAVLTVDVDVYKGPLANHPDVQSNQAANLAISAKPLLGKLRYEIEFRAQKSGNRFGRDDITPVPSSTVDELIRNGKQLTLQHLRDLSDFVPPDRYPFLSAKAAAVNQLLALYSSKEESAWATEKIQNLPLAIVPSVDPSTRSYLQSAPLAKAVEGGDRSPDVKSHPEVAQARPPSGLGLESLISDYEIARKNIAALSLKDSAGELPRNPRYPEQIALFHSLLTFAQRLQFVADNDILVPGHVQGVFENSFDLATPLTGGREKGAAGQSYVRTLQAIGNGITVRINELREQSEYISKIERAGPRESRATAQVGNKPPAAVIKSLAAGPRADAEAALARIPSPYVDPAVYTASKLEADRTIAEADYTASEAARAKKDAEQASLERVQNLVERVTAGDADFPTIKAYVEDTSGTLTQTSYLNELAKLIDALAQLPRKDAADLIAAKNELARAATNPVVATVEPKLAVRVRIAELYSKKNVSNPFAVGLDTLRSELKALEQHAGSDRKILNDLTTALVNRKSALLNNASADLIGNLSPAALGIQATDIVSFNEVIARVAKNLREIEKAESDTDKKAVLTAAVDYVSSQRAAVNAVALDNGNRDSVDVLDEVIATLRYERINAITVGGEVAGEKWQKAIDIARGNRADMAYLRPASSYLRTSFPATSLQRDAKLGWENMLLDHAWHQLPLLGEVTASNVNLRTLQELDKQYWQNVNTVRVAGGGNTNYVVVKDDVGNWYVKNMSTDPKDIIQSAQSLALFGAGQALGAPGLLAAAVEQKEAAKVAAGGMLQNDAGSIKKVKAANEASMAGGSKSATLSVQPAGPVVGVQFARAQEEFNVTSKDHFGAFLSDARALHEKVETKWKADAGFSGADETNIKAKITEIAKTADDALKTDLDAIEVTFKKAPDERNSKTDGSLAVDILTKVRDYRDGLLSKVDEFERTYTVPAPKPTAEAGSGTSVPNAEKTNAAAAVKAVREALTKDAGALINSNKEKRSVALTRFDTQLGVIETTILNPAPIEPPPTATPASPAAGNP